MVRFVLFWNRMEPSAGAWNETAFSTLSTAIARAKASGLTVMLDAIHLSGPGGMNYVPGWAKTGDSVTTIQTNGSGYVAELARRYGGDPTVVAYDPVNEPHRYPVDPTGVLSMYQTLIAAIRAVDTDTLIAIEPTYGTASQSGACAPNWSILTNRKNLVLSVHDYYHGGDDNGFDTDCTSSVSAAAYNGNKAALATHLSDWRAASTASGLPVWIGEFGINSGAAGHDQWITDVVSLYCSNGWNHSWWEYYSSSPALSATNPDKTWKSWVGLTRC
jgi:aryl-phospho-beta-D-glucosidase BglC (GH1 family)